MWPEELQIEWFMSLIYTSASSASPKKKREGKGPCIKYVPYLAGKGTSIQPTRISNLSGREENRRWIYRNADGAIIITVGEILQYCEPCLRCL
jgi:hypothetical protein